MRFLLLTGIAMTSASIGNAAPAIPWANDPYQRCVIDNFQQTNAILGFGSKQSDKILAELEKPVPDWPKLRRLIVERRQNDILFRKEMYRVELKCLDTIPAKDRITSLKREFRKIEPPQLIKAEPPHR